VRQSKARRDATDRVSSFKWAAFYEFESDYRSFVSRRGAPEEMYWRGLGADRQLLAIESESYRVRLVEHVRSPYWKEDVYKKLEKVKTRP